MAAGYERFKLRLNLSKSKEVDQRGHCKKTSEEIAEETKGLTVKTYDCFGNLTGSYKS